VIQELGRALTKVQTQRCGAWGRFYSVAVLTQLSINSGERLFPVGYRDPPYEPYVNQVFDVPSDNEDEFDDDQSL
jgi:hypothetical protein